MPSRNVPRKPPETKSLDAIKRQPLPAGKPIQKAKLSAEAEAHELEAKQLANERTRLENKKVELGNKEIDDRLKQRRQYAQWTFWLVCVWLSVVLILIAVQGFGGFHDRLSEKVLVATVATTTVNVLGMLAIILHGLYPENKS